MEAGEFCELFLGEFPFGAELSDPVTEILDQGAVEHSAQNYTYCMQRSTYNAYQLSEAEYPFSYFAHQTFSGVPDHIVSSPVCAGEFRQSC